MLTPQDPNAFRARVLRRAVQLERRRRRARTLVVISALVAVVLGVVVVTQNRPGPATIVAGPRIAALASEVVAVPGVGEPWAVVGGTDGSMWVLGLGSPATLTRIGKGASAATFDLPRGAQPEAIVAGTDHAIWATDPRGSRVLRVDSAGRVTTWPSDSRPSPTGTWLGGRFWFAEPRLDRLTGVSTGGDVVHHDVPRGRAPTAVSAGPDGSLWYASSTTARVGSVSPSGAVNEVDLRSDERAVAMATGPGPALWMVLLSRSGSRLAHLDPQAHVVGDDIPSTHVPAAVSIGPDGHMWFAPGDDSVHEQSPSKLTIRQLGRHLQSDSWALASDDSMWAVDRAARTVVRITLD